MKPIDAKELDGRIDQNVTVYYKNGRPYTGVVCERVKNRLDLVYHVRKGEKNGVELEVYPSGRIQSIRHYKQNVLHGPLIRFYKNGALEEEAMFENGELVEPKSFDKKEYSLTVDLVLNIERAGNPWIKDVQHELVLSE